MNGMWLSILDYAKLKSVSISTIRRHIKANKVRYKSESGKYLIFVDHKDRSYSDQAEELKHKLEVELLKIKIRELEEENNDLKMLVHLYENGHMIANKSEVPSVPLS